MPDNETQIAFSPTSDGHESCRAFGPISPLNVRQQNALRESLATELRNALGLPSAAGIEFGSERQGETWASFIAYEERSKTGKTQQHVDSYSNNPNWLAYTVTLRYTLCHISHTHSHAQVDQIRSGSDKQSHTQHLRRTKIHTYSRTHGCVLHQPCSWRPRTAGGQQGHTSAHLQEQSLILKSAYKKKRERW